MKFCKIKKIRNVNPLDVYHLNVEKNHNFFANNICVHNCDYRGEVGVILHCVNGPSLLGMPHTQFKLTKGMRIAQMAIREFDIVELNVIDELNETARGAGGFGSSGV